MEVQESVKRSVFYLDGSNNSFNISNSVYICLANTVYYNSV
jgi:hypothetical protein